MNFEGIGYGAVDPASNDPNAAPVYRFFDTHDGGHFFTTSTAERDQVQITRADMKFEGIGYSEHTTQQVGDGACIGSSRQHPEDTSLRPVQLKETRCRPPGATCGLRVSRSSLRHRSDNITRGRLASLSDAAHRMSRQKQTTALSTLTT